MSAAAAPAEADQQPSLTAANHKWQPAEQHWQVAAEEPHVTTGQVAAVVAGRVAGVGVGQRGKQATGVKQHGGKLARQEIQQSNSGGPATEPAIAAAEQLQDTVAVAAAAKEKLRRARVEREAARHLSPQQLKAAKKAVKAAKAERKEAKAAAKAAKAERKEAKAAAKAERREAEAAAAAKEERKAAKAAAAAKAEVEQSAKAAAATTKQAAAVQSAYHQQHQQHSKKRVREEFQVAATMTDGNNVLKRVKRKGLQPCQLEQQQKWGKENIAMAPGDKQQQEQHQKQQQQGAVVVGMADALQVASHSNHGSKKRKQEVGGAACQQHPTGKKLKLQTNTSADLCHLAAPPTYKHQKHQWGAACGTRPALAAGAAGAPSLPPARDGKQPRELLPPAAAAGVRAAAERSNKTSRAVAAARDDGQDSDPTAVPQLKHQQQQCDLLQRVARLTGSLGGVQAQQNNAANAFTGSKRYVMQSKVTCPRPRW